MSIYLHLCCPMDSHASRLIHLVTSTLGTLLTTSRYLIRICWVTMSLQKERKGQEVACRCNLVGVVLSLLIHFFCTFSCSLQVRNQFEYAFGWSSPKKAKHDGISESMVLTVSLWVWCEEHQKVIVFLPYVLFVSKCAMSRKGLSCLVSASIKLEKFV